MSGRKGLIQRNVNVWFLMRATEKAFFIFPLWVSWVLVVGYIKPPEDQCKNKLLTGCCTEKCVFGS